MILSSFFTLGRIVNVTSVKGRLPTAFCAAYTSAKWAGKITITLFSRIPDVRLHSSAACDS